MGLSTAVGLISRSGSHQLISLLYWMRTESCGFAWSAEMVADSGSASNSEAEAPLQTPLSQKLDFLSRSVHPPERGEYTFEEVADAVRAGGGPTISATYIWQLRKGIRDNPTKKHLEALAGFFGVPPAYFFDD